MKCEGLHPPFVDHSSRCGANGTQACFPGLDRGFSAPFAQDPLRTTLLIAVLLTVGKVVLRAIL